MSKSRLEAFSDGVIAIIITIMVLALQPVHNMNLMNLHLVLPTLGSYLVSFLFVAIYWVNHHHLFQMVRVVDTRILWYNMNLLFWLSLFPWVTASVGENLGNPLGISLYACVTLICGISSNLLRREVERHIPQDHDHHLHHLRRNRRSMIALSCYFGGVVIAWVSIPVAILLVIFPMMMYLFADKIFPEQKMKST